LIFETNDTLILTNLTMLILNLTIKIEKFERLKS
jgi:hypothetical protein